MQIIDGDLIIKNINPESKRKVHGHSKLRQKKLVCALKRENYAATNGLKTE